MSLYGTRDAAANWEDADAKVLHEHHFERGVACPCSFYSRERGTGSSSTETISCQVTEAPVGMDEEYRELALRVEAHHIGSVQRSEQVAGHVEQDYWPAG